MGNDENIKKGYWAIATQKHLKNFRADVTHKDEFDSLDMAGKSGRLLGVIRGNYRIDNILKIEKMASSIGIGRRELHRIVLPELENATEGEIELIKNSTDDIVGIEEYLFNNDSVLDITGQVFENLNPKEVEQIAVETMDATKKMPQMENELIQSLCIKGYKEENISLSCSLQTYFRLVQKLAHGKEAIYSNEYVWGSNHEKIAHAVAGLSLNSKQTLQEVITQIQNFQGIPSDKINPIDTDLLLLAKKVGMINPTSIITRRNFRKEFCFSSNLIDNNLYNDDIMDDVKLFIASIRFGENYTQHSTITSAQRFLRYLINNEKIGPHSANGTDYTLLEERGIIKVEKAYGDRYYMHLLRKDVAEEALKIISNPNFNINVDVNPNQADALMERGSFISPEEERLKLGEAPENVSEAMDYLARTLRDETL